MSALPPKADITAAQTNVRLCQKQTYAVQEFGQLLDDLVGELQEMHGHIQAQRLGGLEVDNQRYFDWHLDRKVPWLLALENPVNVLRCLGILLGEIRPVRNQAA